MKLLYFSAPTWMFFTPEQMYGEEGKLRSAHRHYLNADLYFLSKMQKVRFRPSKTRVTADGRLDVTISIGDPKAAQERRFVFPVIELLFSLDHISRTFKDRERFFEHCLLGLYSPSKAVSKTLFRIGRRFHSHAATRSFGLQLLKWSYAREVSVTHRNDFEVAIIDPLTREITDPRKVEESRARNPTAFSRREALLNAPWDRSRLAAVDFNKLPGDSTRGAMRLTVDQVINHFGIDVGPQEVVYIGKTERQPFDRLLPHSDLQELQAKCLRSDGEAIVVHLFKFRSEDVTPRSQKASTVSPSLLTSAIEAELINYFKPEMNEKYVGDSEKRNWKHIKYLQTKDYAQIRVQLEIDKQYTRFFTRAVPPVNPTRHYFAVSLGSLKRTLVPDVARPS